ncbi:MULTISPECIES: hypothetical protein [Kordiimonas]|jgi:hypothetical protein|uniref:hypothetical protein n=1 Tax=Kordiimonas TaxID=288021 RepID=UPI0025802D8C|nr:hypothetical protein [Kordiimonas sp. UBA4487]
MGQDSQAGAWGALSSLKEEPVTQPVSLPSFRVGKVLSDTFAIFFANFFRFWAVALVVMAPTAIGFWAMGVFMGPAPDAPMPADPIGFFISFFGTLAWVLASIAVMMAAVIYGAIEYQTGRKAPLVDMLKVGVRSGVPVVVAMVLSVILYMIGWMLFIVPGIIVAMMLCVTVPAIVAEKLGPLKAIRRSRELTSGFKWPILGCFLVMAVVAQVVNLALMMPMILGSTVNVTPGTVGFVYSAVTTTLMGSVYVFFGSGVASIYTNLRAAKEGTSADDIAKVFE